MTFTFYPLIKKGSNFREIRSRIFSYVCTLTREQGKVKRGGEGKQSRKFAWKFVEMKRSKREKQKEKEREEKSRRSFFFFRMVNFSWPSKALARWNEKEERKRGSRFPIVAKSTSKYLRRNLVTTAASGKARKIHSKATLVAAATARKTRFRPFDVP